MRTTWITPVLVLLSFLVPVAAATGQDSHRGADGAFPETITVLQAVLKGELLAHARYVAYAAKAREEKYPRIAALAIALAASEAIHARNFQKVLMDLGADAATESPPVAVRDTRSNLHAASTAELEEIDSRYPGFIKRIAPEKYEEAISDLTHAWQAEKQHRDLITQLIYGSGLLFGVLARTIEGTPVVYFICTRCGCTVPEPELPKDACPICAGPVSDYSQVDTGT
jgi:rubrerythrin